MSTASSISPARAKELTESIRKGLKEAQEALKEFITGQGWLGMGHRSFAAWYGENLMDIPLAVGLRINVVYQLLEEGMSCDQIDVNGFGPETIERIDHQRRHGVPADLASAKGGRRGGSGRRPSHVYLDLGTELYAQLTEVARRRGQTVEEAAKGFVETGVRYTSVKTA